MSSPPPTTFLAILLIGVALFIWWRATLIVLAAILIAVLAFGVNEVRDRIDLRSQTEAVTEVGPSPGIDGEATGR
ncbi:MAG: hypothetical protein ACRDT0_09410 [Pseudonocardiaceae bacterium]